MEPRRNADSPLPLRGRTLRNRLVATAHASGLVVDGLPVAGDAEYWGRIAAGGAAMLISGGTVVAPESTIRRRNFVELWRPEVVAGLAARVDAIHADDGLAVCQLLHLGRETLGAETYYAPVAPSALRSPRELTEPRPLGDHEIDELVSAFRISTEHAVAAGFDGLELHAAHGYLLGQLLSPATNRRPGAETLAGRLVALDRIVSAVRSVAPDAILGIRLTVGDADQSGLSLDQLAELVPRLDSTVDYVNLTVGVRTTYVRDMATDQPPLVPDVARIRPLVDRPLLISQAFRNLGSVEQALAAGADLVGMARALIADPDFPRKVLTGREHEVRPCVACNEDCRAFDPVLLCTVNPDLAPPGFETRPAAPLALVGTRPTAPLTLRPAGAPSGSRRTAIVGAGPAGLECALTLARAGEPEIVVFERAERIGGQLALAADAPNRSGWRALLDFYGAQLAASGVDVRLGDQPAAAELAEFSDVVLAVGCAEERQPAGVAVAASGEALATGADGLAGARHLVIADDGSGWWPGVNLVELGVLAGIPEITVVTPAAAFAAGIPAESRVQLMGRLSGASLRVMPLTTLTAATDGTVELRAVLSGDASSLQADRVVAVGMRSPLPLDVPDGPRVQAIGDCIVPRRAAHAIAEGRAAATAVLATR